MGSFTMHLSSVRNARRDEPPPRELVSYAGRMLWAIWSLTIAAAVFLALRVYCKLSRHRMLWWDDHFLIASWVLVLASTAMLTEGVKYGIGLYWEDMDPLKLPVVLILSYASGLGGTVAAAWSKTSFAITLLRISNGWVKWVLWFIIISVNVALGVSGLILWIQCWPLQKLWMPDVEGACWPKLTVERYQTFTTVYSGVLDIVLAIFPWKIIWHVTINRREKVGALAAMSMGVFSGIIAFLRIISLGDISASSTTTVDIKVFGIAEPAVSIIAASIPILRALIRKAAPSQERSIQFVQFSQNPTHGAQSLRSTSKGSNEVLVNYASAQSQIVAATKQFEYNTTGSDLPRDQRDWSRN